jgi:hypothetical protein
MPESCRKLEHLKRTPSRRGHPPELQEPPEQDVPELEEEPYHGPDPEADEKGDEADEDQGT